MFLVLRKKSIVIAALLIAAIAVAAVSGVVIADAVQAAPDNFANVVVLDAGHGGIDVGVKGVVSGNKESDINLMITKEVAALLKKENIKAVLTRETEDGLYGDSIENFKRRDMEARRDVILNTKPDLVVSIHCNKFPDRSRRGAQCFFEERSSSSKALAVALQNAFNPINSETVNREFDALAGDYYMLKCSSYPSAIAECGFLSNAEDDALLATPEHRTRVATAIVEGIKAFLALPKE